MQYYVEEAAGSLRELFEKEVLMWPNVIPRTMFGCPAYTVDGRLFAFLVTKGIVITKLRLRHREALSEDFELIPFEAGERVIKRWMLVVLPSPERVTRIMGYVKESYQAAVEQL